MNKPKIFVSQPMDGLSKEEVMKIRNELVKEFTDTMAVEDYEVIDTRMTLDGGPLSYLGKSIELMDEADVVLMAPGWNDARGCVMEFKAAKEYGKKTYMLSDGDFTIKIKSTKNADSKSTTIGAANVTLNELYENSRTHAIDVGKGMNYIAELIMNAGVRHDWTKLDHGIHDFHDIFVQGLTAEEFRKQEWFQRHIHEERHHVKDYCHDDVNLIDIIEHIVDIVMAGMGRSGEVTPDELDPEILAKAYANTIKLMSNVVELEE